MLKLRHNSFHTSSFLSLKFLFISESFLILFYHVWSLLKRFERHRFVTPPGSQRGKELWGSGMIEMWKLIYFYDLILNCICGKCLNHYYRGKSTLSLVCLLKSITVSVLLQSFTLAVKTELLQSAVNMPVSVCEGKRATNASAGLNRLWPEKVSNFWPCALSQRALQLECSGSSSETTRGATRTIYWRGNIHTRKRFSSVSNSSFRSRCNEFFFI